MTFVLLPDPSSSLNEGPIQMLPMDTNSSEPVVASEGLVFPPVPLEGESRGINAVGVEGYLK